MIEAVRKILPKARHRGDPAPTGRCEPVVFARVSAGRFHPFGGEEAVIPQPVQQGIDGSFADDQIGFVLEMPDDFQAVKRAAPMGRENGKFEGAFAELHFPFIGRVR